jgi:hypothetical protein
MFLFPWHSAIRLQGFSGDVPAVSEGLPRLRREMAVLDYPTQQHALMPLLAWAYALQASPPSPPDLLFCLTNCLTNTSGRVVPWLHYSALQEACKARKDMECGVPAWLR